MHFFIALVRLILLCMFSLVYLVFALIVWNISFRNRTTGKVLVKYWGRIVLLILNVKVDVSGQKPSSRNILMPNHRGYLDIFIVLACYPSSIVAKKELLRWPVIGQASILARIIPVDRSRSGSLIQTMRLIRNEISSGGSVILFPEGQTFKGPLTKPFKPGSFQIALETNTPVVPAVIWFADENDAWVDDDLFIPHFFRQMGKWRTSTKFWFGEPLLNHPVEKLMFETRRAIHTKLAEFNQLSV
jgi:1-acyl-sn-glycerol-3-phosphate acyltransferase